MVLLQSSWREHACGKCNKPYRIKHNWVIFGLTALIGTAVAIPTELLLMPNPPPSGGMQNFGFVMLILAVATVASGRLEKADG